MAQPSLPKASLRWLSSSIDLGQPVEVELALEASGQTRFFLADTELAFAPFEYLGIRRCDSIVVDNRLVRTTRFRVCSFQLQEEQILRLVIFYNLPGSTTQTITISSNPISFKPRITGDPEHFLFVYNPRRILIPEPVDLTRFWLIGFALVTSFLLVGFMLRRSIRRWWLRRRFDRYARRLRAELLAVRELVTNRAAFIQQLNRIWKEDLQRAWPVVDLRWRSCTSDELSPALRRYSSLSDDEIDLLTQLCRQEDHIFYGREPVDQGQLLHFWHRVDVYLQSELRRRRKAIS